MKNSIAKLIILIFLIHGSFSINSQTNLNQKASKSDPNVPIFEIKNDAKQTVFAVYPGGVKIFIDDKLKAAGGGFTVGRLGTGKASSGDFFIVNPGDVRVNITDNRLKAAGGGFTVGRLGTGKKAAGEDLNFLSVTPDSTRVYISQRSKSGFAVGKLGDAKTGTENFLNLTPDNYFIGHNSGRSTTGLYNLFLGYQAGYRNTLGYQNFFAGYKAGIENTTGFHNVFIGPESGISNVYGKRNIFVGYLAGSSNVGIDSDATIGHDNIYIGTRAGEGNIEGQHNTLIGSFSGYQSTGTKNTFYGAFTGFSSSGTANVFVGVDAGRENNEGNNNVFVGAIAGNNNSNSANTFVGYGSGYNNLSGQGNVFLGHRAGQNELGSDRLYVDNTSTASPLLFGEFDNNRIVINGNSEHNTISSTLFVNGVAGGTSDWAVVSDKRFKTNILTIPNALQKILMLRGVNFNWKNTEKGDPDTKIGFIAQEVETVIPEVVFNTGDKYSMQYAPITALLVEGMKEQQILIEKLNNRIKKLEEKNQLFESKVSDVEQLRKDLNELKILINELKK